jgi:hypothetical protein
MVSGDKMAKKKKMQKNIKARKISSVAKVTKNIELLLAS